MGLLDSIQNFAASDEGMGLAQGLLSARGSAGLAAGLAGMNAAKDNAMKREFMQMQMKNYASEIAQREAALKKQQESQALIASMFGGQQPDFAGGQKALEQVSAAGGQAGPTVQAASLMAPKAGGTLGNMSLDQIARLKLAGVDLSKEWELANKPTSLAAGAYSQIPGQAPVYMADPTKGYTMGPNGSVQLMPGAAEAQATLAGANKGAEARANANFDVIEIPMGNGQTQRMPRADAIQMLRGSMQPSQAQQMPSVGQIPSVGQFQPTAQQIAQIMADAKANGIQNPFVNFTQPPSAQSTAGFGRTQSPAELAAQEADKTKQIELAKADAARQSGDVTKSSAFKDFRQQLGMAETLLNSGPTNSAFGSVIDKAAGAFGMSPSSANVAASLRTLSGWMMQNIPKAPGAQSDAELKDYKTAAGLVGDETVPVAQRLAALKVVNGIVDNWEAKMQGNGSIAAPKQSTDIPALPANPTASSLTKGQSYMLPNGKVGKWNGMTFKVE